MPLIRRLVLSGGIGLGPRLALEPKAQASESAHCFPRICTAMTSVHPLGNLKAREGGNDNAQYTEETKAQEGKPAVTCAAPDSQL